MRGDAFAGEALSPPGQVRESLDEIRFALACGGLGVWRLDLATCELATSPMCRTIFARDPDGPFTDADLREAVHTDDKARMAAAMEQSLATGDDYDIEVRILIPGGEVRWVQIRARPSLDADGTPSMAGVMQNITSRKREDARRLALLELGDRIRDLVDPAALAFAAAEIVGRTLDVSRAGYGTVDLPAETITIERDWNAPGIASLAGVLCFRDFGSYIDDLRRGETVLVADAGHDPRTALTAPALTAISARALLNMPVSEHGRVVALFFLNHAAARCWPDDDVGFVREVTARTRTAVERLRAEQDLRALAASLEQQVEARTLERDRAWKHSLDLQVVVDHAGVIRAASEAWFTILGWRPHEVVGRHHLAFNHPDNHEASAKALLLSSTEALPPYEMRCKHKDGSHRWVSWVAAPGGDLIYASGRDITAEKATAAEVAAIGEQLRQSQKLEAVGQLTGGVAHDFNNLLTVIRSSTDLLKRPNLSAERRTRYVDAISDTVDRAAKLTGQLLAFARRQALRPEVFDVGASVRSVIDMLGTLTGSRIEIVTSLPPQACFVDADASQFDTALVNIAVNARDAMNGEGRLTVAVAATQAVPATRAHPAVDGAFAAVSITDTGCGIAPDQLEQVFEPFFTTKGVGQGTGLGLSQVFGFAKQSGGEVVVRSEVGCGTTFTLYLPRVAAAMPASVDHLPEQLADGHGTRVLVVEDNADVGTFATQTLAELGYLTTLAPDAERALRELEAGVDRFDVVFSDVVMPGMNGVELAREIRRRHAGLPVVLCSGYSHVLAQEGTYGFEFLRKPYSVEQLSRVLCKASRCRRSGVSADA